MAEYIKCSDLNDIIEWDNDIGKWVMRDSDLEALPAVDLTPVVHGRWVSLTECANEGVYCSVCHKKVYKADYAWSNKRIKMRSAYCPNCGARMDGDNDG